MSETILIHRPRTEINEIQKCISKCDFRINSRVNYYIRRQSRANRDRARSIFTGYAKQITENISLFLQHVQDDILFFLLRDPSLAPLFHAYFAQRGDLREPDLINLRDFLSRYIRNEPPDKAQQWMKLFSDALCTLGSLQELKLEQNLTMGSNVWIKLGKIALRETLPMWILHIVHLDNLSIFWRRNGDKDFKSMVLVSVPLMLKRIWDSRDYRAYQELEYSQWGKSARKWLFAPNQRNSSIHYELCKDKCLSGTWPCVEVEIDWNSIKQDQHIFNRVFQNWSISQRTSTFRLWHQENHFPHEIYLHTAFHRSLISCQEGNVLRRDHQSKEMEIKKEIMHIRESRRGILSKISDQELYAFYKSKELKKLPSRGLKRKYGSSYLEPHLKYIVDVRSPFVFHFRARFLYQDSELLTDPFRLWSSSNRISRSIRSQGVGNGYHAENGEDLPMEVIQLFDTPYRSLQISEYLQRKTFPCFWHEVVCCLQGTFYDYFQKSKDSPELTLVFNCIFMYISFY